MNFTISSLIAGFSICVALTSIPAEAHADNGVAGGESPGTIHVPAFDLPTSRFLSPQAKETLRHPPEKGAGPGCPSILDLGNRDIEKVKAARACLADQEKPFLDQLRARFQVEVVAKRIADVPVEEFTPKAGVSPRNKDRILINLHGGAYVAGSPGQESIPIAATARIRVVGVDYRMPPENKFPAASEDIAAVYKELLKEYVPANIGIYGCSAGGKLTAQATAWLQKSGLPAPGAIGIFGTGAAPYVDGDSAYFMGGNLLDTTTAILKVYAGEHPDLRNPLLNPLSSQEMLAKFPPTLFISATRDWGLSNAVYTHTQLIKLGVPADLHVWEGLGHCFFGDPDLPESREANAVIVSFFDSWLGKKRSPRQN